MTDGFAPSLIIYCAGHAQKETGNIIPRVFESKAALTLGMFSCSLYSIHYPVIMMTHLVKIALHLPSLPKLAVEMTLCIRLFVGAGYLFYLLVERHFVQNQVRSGAKI